MAEVLVDEAERDLLQRGVDGSDLGGDVDAVGVVFDEPLKPAPLTFDRAEPEQVAIPNRLP